MDGWVVMIAAVASLVGGLGATAFTRRSAKEKNAGDLYGTLTASQTAELKRLADRLSAVEDDREESRKLAREYERWGRALLRRLREALPNEDFPDPPPLDT